MAHSQTWDEARPADSDAIGQGDDEIRLGVKTAIRERLAVGHYYPVGGGASSDMGKHATDATNKRWSLWNHDCTAEILRITYDTGGGTYELDATIGANDLILKDSALKVDPGHQHERLINVPLVGTAGVQTGIVITNLSTTRTFTLLGVQLACFTAPSATSLSVDVEKIASFTTATNPGSGGTSVFTAGFATIAAGAFRGAEKTDITLTTLAPVAAGVHMAWVFNIETLSAAAGIVATLRVAL